MKTEIVMLPGGTKNIHDIESVVCLLFMSFPKVFDSRIKTRSFMLICSKFFS